MGLASCLSTTFFRKPVPFFAVWKYSSANEGATSARHEPPRAVRVGEQRSAFVAHTIILVDVVDRRARRDPKRLAVPYDWGLGERVVRKRIDEMRRIVGIPGVDDHVAQSQIVHAAGVHLVTAHAHDERAVGA